MKKSQLSSCVFLLVLTLSFSVSWETFHSLDVTPGSENLMISCIQFNSNNVTSISQLIFTPVNTSFLPIWQVAVQNTRFIKPSTPKPSVIVTPVEETLIQTALYCAKKHGYEIRIRSGGHDFEGLSYTADVPFAMIDFTNMRSIEVDVPNRLAWVQAGAVVGDLYYSISQKTDTLYFPAGVCPTVGFGGYIGGGGYGNLMRKHGTAADNVLDVRFMDVNGNILNRMSMGEDLFWAIRGGGASSFGIVLAWKLQLVPVPERVTVFILNKTLEEGATEIFHKYQYVAPSIDRNLHIRTQVFGEYISNTTKKTIRIMFEGIYQGTIDTLLPLLDQNFPELGVIREICQEVKTVQSTLMFWGLPSSTSTEILTNRSAIAKLDNKSKSDYVRTPIPISGLKKIWRKLFENDESALLMINPLGGRMADYSETAIPYPHRVGVLYQVLKTVNFFDQSSDTTPISLSRIAWLESLEKLLTPFVSNNPREAYANYVDLDLGVGSDNYEEASVWGERYWKRNNFKKLIRIKAKVDPKNFFRHPQSIPVF
ncbi:tetrahydroberberine oxidase [Lactuca sativa]|nr:tetrahydroberberine oxidase [Lactuca sativa]